MKEYKIIIDTDIADDIDDAFALKYALTFKQLNLLGVTTVFKNVHQRSQITKEILRLERKNGVGVFAGEDTPLSGYIPKFDYETMINDKIQLLSYKNDYSDIEYEKEHAVDFILRMIKEHDGDLILVAIGPLTNLAKAYLKDPETFKKLSKIVMMNGTHLGWHEWNVLVDPEASKIIYECGVPIDTVGVDITQQTTFTDEEYEIVLNKKTGSNAFISEMMVEWFIANKRNPVMHDSLPISSLIYDFLEFESFDVQIPLDKDNRGKTLATKNDTSHIRFATKFNKEAFMKHYINQLGD